MINITFRCEAADKTTQNNDATIRSRSWTGKGLLKDLQQVFPQEEQQVPQKEPVEDKPVKKEPVEEQYGDLSPEAKEKLPSVGGSQVRGPCGAWRSGATHM